LYLRGLNDAYFVDYSSGSYVWRISDVSLQSWVGILSERWIGIDCGDSCYLYVVEQWVLSTADLIAAVKILAATPQTIPAHLD
jgi:hypothetical protein